MTGGLVKAANQEVNESEYNSFEEGIRWEGESSKALVVYFLTGPI